MRAVDVGAVAWWGYVACLAVLGVYAAHRLWLILASWRAGGARPRAPLALPEPALPVITVQLPLYNEAAVAARLIDAAAALDWPRDRFEIQILDDSTDATSAVCAARAAAWQAAGVDVVHLRRDDRAGFKAGALARGLASARGELVLVLDADFVPAPTILRAAVGHFADPRVALVQLRWEHLNRGASLLTEVQALLLDGHFVVEQASRARGGRFFNFNGTAGVWRRAAIVDAGGWQSDTLTEDLDLSYRALLRGWRFVYRLDQAVPAELPADMVAFESQQFRWAKGSVQVARKLLPAVLRAPLPWRVKLDAFFHLTQNVPYLVTFGLLFAMVPALLARGAPSPGELAWIHLPAVVLSALTLISYCVTSQKALGRRNILATLARLPAYVAITAGISFNQARAVLEGALGKPSEFVRTPKTGAIGARPVARRCRPTYDRRTIVELLMAAQLAAGAAIAVSVGRVAIAVPLALFAAGFAWGRLGRR